MKKLVNESLNEFLLANGEEPINEGKIKDWFNKAKGLIMGVFKKVGNFFVAYFHDKPVPAVAPVNIGIMVKSRNLKGVSYIPSSEDLEMESSLSALKNTGDKMIERARKEFDEMAAKNKANKTLIKKWDNYRVNESVNEEEIKLPYTGADEDKVRNVNTKFLIKRLMMQCKNPLLIPPLIYGAPGIGKTAITKGVIRALGPGHRVIDVQTAKMGPDDWTLPKVGARMFVDYQGKEVLLDQAIDIPKNWLPVFIPSGDPEEDSRRNDIANQGEGGILFLDEISRASAEVQNTCMKLVDERIIGEAKLGSKWAIVAASNRITDDPETQTDIGQALADRFQLFNFVPTVDEWLEWAKGVDLDPRITNFVEFNREHYYLFDTDVKLHTTPRKWEKLSEILQASLEFGDIIWSKADLEDLIGGTIHPKTTEALVAFLVLLERWTPEQILMVYKDPKKAPKPSKKGGGWDMVQARALMGAACSALKDRTLEPKEVENYVQYFIDLGNASLASQALFLLVETHHDINYHIGQIKDGKHDKYKKAMDMYRAAYGNITFAKREDVMGSV